MAFGAPGGRVDWGRSEALLDSRLRGNDNRGELRGHGIKGIKGTPYLFMLVPLFWSRLPPFQDTPQSLLKLFNKTVISQGSACPLMSSYPLDLLLGYATLKKIPPIPHHFKQGLDFNQIVASA